MKLSPKEASIIFKKEYPDYEISKMCIYKGYYLIGVEQDFANFDYGMPYYAVNMRSGKIVPMSTGDDIAGFAKAFVNKSVSFS